MFIVKFIVLVDERDFCFIGREYNVSILNGSTLSLYTLNGQAVLAESGREWDNMMAS